MRKLADVSSHSRWLQSALNVTVEAGLAVDGVIGWRTKAAIRDFQQKSVGLGVGPLAVDGILGPQTLAALQNLVGKRPAGAPPGELTARALFDELLVDHHTKFGELRAERVALAKMAQRLGLAWTLPEIQPDPPTAPALG